MDCNRKGYDFGVKIMWDCSYRRTLVAYGASISIEKCWC